MAANISRLAGKAKIQRYKNRLFGGGLPVGPTALGGTPDSLTFANDPVSMNGSTLAGVLGAAYNAFIVLDGNNRTRRENMLAVGASEKSHPLQVSDPFDSQMGLLEQGLYKPAPCQPAPANQTAMSRDLTVFL